MNQPSTIIETLILPEIAKGNRDISIPSEDFLSLAMSSFGYDSGVIINMEKDCIQWKDCKIRPKVMKSSST